MINNIDFADVFGYTGQVLIILMLTAISCALIGSFLVLRKLSMVSDALAHSVLLGIVLAFFITKDINSPFLIIGAALFGLFTVFAIETLGKTGLVENDDAVGIVFPLFFALAVILITKYARNVHIDTDVVLMGEVIMAPLNKMAVGPFLIPKSMFNMAVMLVINVVFILLFYKELKITTFDKEFATIAGFSASILFYLLMALTSLTSVIAFDAVGAILVVSFLIAPGASAYMLTKSLRQMLWTSVLFAVVNSLVGFYLGMHFNVSISGMTAAVAGVTFFLTFLFNPNGLITSLLRRRENKRTFRQELMLMHIGNHMGETDECEELGCASLHEHLQWSVEEVNRKIEQLTEKGYVRQNKRKKIYELTKSGKEKYDEIKVSYGM